LSNNPDIRGETVLIQDLYHLCTEKIINSNSEKSMLDLMGYYHNFDKVCGAKLSIECTKAILKKMKIFDEVHKCFQR